MPSLQRRGYGVGIIVSLALCAVLGMCLWAPQALSAQQSAAQPQLPALVVAFPEWILTNGKILTVDKNFSIVEAIAIRDGRVLAVGSNRTIEQLAGPKTERMDLAQKTVIPGLIDTHLHTELSAMSRSLAEIAKTEPKYRDFMDEATVKGSSVAELLQNIKTIVASRKPGTWVQVNVGSPELSAPFWNKIRRGDLDKIAPDHLLMVNTDEVRGVTINTKVVQAIKDFYGFMPLEFEVDESGLNNGRIDVTLVESLIGDLMIDHPMKSLYPAFKQDLERVASYGVTTRSGRMISFNFQPVYREMERRREMPIRLAYSALGTQVFPHAGDFYKRLGDVTDMGTDWLWMPGAGVVHVDLDPCTTIKPGTLPCLIAKPTDVKRQALYQAVKYGNRIVNTHVAGDQAVDQMMDVIEEASKAAGMTPNQIRAKAHTIDHCTLNPRPDQIERGKRLGIIWSCAGNRLENAQKWADEYGVEYAHRWVSPVASILKAGGLVAGHGEGMSGDSYFTYMEMLLTRKDSKGRVWGKNEAIDRKDLLRMYTVGSAGYLARADRLGSLEPGKFADLAVLDQDYMTIPAEDLDTLHAVLTMVGGKIVYRREKP